MPTWIPCNCSYCGKVDADLTYTETVNEIEDGKVEVVERYACNSCLEEMINIEEIMREDDFDYDRLILDGGEY